jgi:hypothetical protein
VEEKPRGGKRAKDDPVCQTSNEAIESGRKPMVPPSGMYHNDLKYYAPNDDENKN